MAVVVFSLLPFRLLYALSDLLAFLIGDLFAYRSDVIQGNLNRSFPKKSKAELAQITKVFYRNLCDISLEAIKGFSMSPEQIVKRYKFNNPEEMQGLYEQGQSFIAVAGHFSNWEWGTICGGLQFPHHPYGFYKPLANNKIDMHLRAHRAKFRMELVSMADTVACFAKTPERPTVYIMVADQSPSNASKSYWVNFLKQDTACLHGPEKYARSNDLPLYYIKINRINRGYYEFGIELLCEQAALLPEGEPTALYMQALEKQILEEPGIWLWSHRRWKKELPSDKPVIHLESNS